MKHLFLYLILLPTLLAVLVSCGGENSLPAQTSHDAAAEDTAPETQPPGTVSFQTGNVRVQILSDRVIRIEDISRKGGFLDEDTLVAVGRGDFAGTTATLSECDGVYTAKTTEWTLTLIPGKSISEGAAELSDADGNVIWDKNAQRAGFYSELPSPSETPDVYALSDSPRIIPSESGMVYTGSDDIYSGWTQDAETDIYLFAVMGDTEALRNDFTVLTGRTDIPDIKALGSWYSRYQSWGSDEYLAVVSGYRENNFPLDVLIVDTVWRDDGDGTGYNISASRFPDIKGFFAKARNNGVMILFNDHSGKSAVQMLDPSRLSYYTEKLQSLLSLGLSGWWYDRNWTYSLKSPFEHITATTLGQVMYYDISADYAGDNRVTLLSNADWNRNGTIESAPSVIGHRYGIQWTGDITSEALQLREELTNMVYASAVGASPYISSDLGGFKRATQQNEEMYIRWMQYGALSPVFRIHSTSSSSESITKLPYTYSTGTQNTVRNYMNMRSNLLPLFYSLADECYETGMPLCRRLDFYWPGYEQASGSTEYMLGNGLLVSPIWSSYGEGDDIVPAQWLKTEDGTPGLSVSYYNNKSVSGTPVYTGIAETVDFEWQSGSPAAGVVSDGFSAVFDGYITPAEDCYLGIVSDDGARIFIDGAIHTNGWKSSWLVSYVNTVKPLSAGTTYRIRIMYYDESYEAAVRLVYEHITEKGVSARDVFLPDGVWTDLFTGEKYTGGTYRVYKGIDSSPLYAKAGAVIPSVAVSLSVKRADFPELSLNVFTGGNGSFTLYEDDGETNGYKNGVFRKTEIMHISSASGGTIAIEAAKGTFASGYDTRTLTVRIHSDTPVAGILINGKKYDCEVIKRDPSAFPLRESGAAPDGVVYEITVSCPVFSRTEIIYTVKN